MTFESFADLVGRMRDAQRRYFKTRESKVLLEARQLEKDVDLALRQLEKTAGVRQQDLPLSVVGR